MENRIALVTGGLGDIGTAICHEFCDRGAKVIAADHVTKDKALLWQTEQKKLGYDIGLATMDVTKFESCVAMAQDVEKRFGPIDIIVNAAGTINDVSLRSR